MSAWENIVRKAFEDNQMIRHGNPKVIMNDGSPNTSVTAPIGTLCWDYTNSDSYINTDGSTTWVKINA